MNVRMRLGVAITLTGMYVVMGCSDDVTAPEVGSIVLELEADTLSVNQTTQLDATVVGVSGETLSGVAVTFESGNEDIATISDTGRITATGPGSTTIIARTDDRSASITIYVRRAASISVTPGDTTLNIDDRLKLVATVRDAEGASIGAAVSWRQKGSVLQTFDNEGPTAEFGAIRVGSAVITATTEGLSYDINVTVNRPAVGSVLLSPDSLTIERGKSARLTVVVRDTTGVVISDPKVHFDCSCDDTIVTVDSTGLVIAGQSVHPRANTIVARSQGVDSNPVHVRVVLPPSDVEVGSVRLSPDSVRVQAGVGASVQLTVTILDKTGAVVPWLPGEVVFFCGLDGPFSPHGGCSEADQTFANITDSGLVYAIGTVPLSNPQPVTAYYRGVRSNTIWLTIFR